MLVDGLLPFAGLAIYVSYSISIGDFLGLYFYCRAAMFVRYYIIRELFRQSSAG
jgi:hypothetical protein